jgi:hypothetical protein
MHRVHKRFTALTVTCPKIDNNINEKDCVRQTVEGNPSGAKVIIEEGNGHR